MIGQRAQLLSGRAAGAACDLGGRSPVGGSDKLLDGIDHWRQPRDSVGTAGGLLEVLRQAGHYLARVFAASDGMHQRVAQVTVLPQ